MLKLSHTIYLYNTNIKNVLYTTINLSKYLIISMKKLLFLFLLCSVIINVQAQGASIKNTNRPIYKIGDTIQLRGSSIKTLKLKSFANRDSFVVNTFISKLLSNTDTLYNFIVPNTVKNDVYLINAFSYTNQLSDSQRLVRFIPNNIDSLGVIGWGRNFDGQTNIPAGLKNVVQVSGGYRHSLVLKADGTVVAWGNNDFGQTTIPSGLNNVVQISGGYFFNLALKSDGTVVAWGANYSGQVSIPAGLNNVIQISAGSVHSVALKSNGTVVAWGNNYALETNIPAGLNNVIQIVAGGNHTLALKGDSTVVAWGDNSNGQLFIPAGLNNVVQMARGYYHSLVLKADGTLVVWGNNEYLQKSIPAGLNNVVQISAGFYFNLALKADGTVVAWGYNDNYGQTNIPAGLNNVQQIAGVGDHIIAIAKLYVNTTTNIGGSISPTTFVKYGDSLRITFQPNIGYLIDSIFINGVLNTDSLTGYTFKNITKYQNIRVVYKLQTFTIISSAGNGGSISPQGTSSINYVTKLKYTITPSIGYLVDTLFVNGNRVDSTTSYTFDSVKSNQTIRATFKLKTYSIVSSAGTGGSISPQGTSSVNYVTKVQYTITPNTGYLLDTLFVNGNRVDSIKSYTFESVISNQTIRATFKIKTYIINTNRPIYKIGDTIQLRGSGIKSLKLKSFASRDSFVVNTFISKLLSNTDSLYNFIVPNTVKSDVYLINAFSYTNQLSDSIRLVRFFVIPSNVDSLGVIGWGRNYNGQTNIPAGLKNVVQVSGGYRHSLVLKSDGTVVAWGNNDYGQTSIPAGLNNVVQISGADYSSLALKSDGTIVAWGTDYFGEISIPAGLNNVIQISAGSAHSLALKSDGTVVAWGNNHRLEINIPAGLNNVIQISAGGNHSLALKGDGTVVAWGDNSSGQLIIPAGLNNVVQIARGYYHSLALKADGTLVVWGNNEYSQKSIPTGLNNVVQISAGFYFNLALKADKTVVAWGYNDNYGQTNIPAGLNNVQQIAGVGDHIIAIAKLYVNTTTNIGGSISPTTFVKYGDSLRITFQPNIGYLIDSIFINGVLNTDSLTGYTFKNITKYQNIRVVYKLQTFTIISSAGNGGSISPQGTSSINYVTKLKYTITPSIGYLVDTLFVNGNRVDSTTSYTFDSVKSNQTIRATFKLKTYSIVSSAGTGGSISPQGTSSVNYVTKVQYTITPNTGYLLDTLFVNGNRVDSIKSYTFESVISNQTIRATFKIKTYIINTNRPIYKIGDTIQLRGSGIKSLKLKSFASRDSFVVNTFISKLLSNTDSLYNFIVPNTVKSDVYLINAFSYTNQLSDSIRLVRFFVIPSNVDSLGVIGWGRNYNGQTNIPAGLKNVVQVSGGYRHSLVLKSDGTVVAWGNNDYGQTSIPAGLNNVVQISGADYSSLALKSDGTIVAWGTDYFGEISIPAGLNNVIQISAGSAHSLALKSDGTVVAWGNNHSLEINIPAGLNNVIQISAGGNHSLALKGDGTVVAWGDNSSGQLIIPAGLNNVVQIARGYYHSLALKADGTLVVWGNNDYSQKSIPTGLNNVVQISAGFYFNLALKADGTVVAWGYNDNYGQTNIPAGLNNVQQIAGVGDHIIAIAKLYVNTTTNIGGSISPTTFVKYGDSLRITFQPNNGYFIDSIFINGVLNTDSLTGYTFKNITKYQNVRVVYKLQTFTIISNAGNGGSISPQGTSSINYVTKLQYTITPNIRYELDTLFVNGNRVDSTTSYTFDSVKSNQTIRATFKLKTYSIVSSAGTGGSISPQGTSSVNYVTKLKYTITPNIGYVVDTLFVNGNRVDSTKSYTFESVISNQTIRATFKLNTYIINTNRPTYKIGDTIQLRGNSISFLKLKSFASRDSFVISNFITKTPISSDTNYTFIVPNKVKNDVYIINAFSYTNQLSDSIRLVRFFVIPNNIDSLGVIAWGDNSYGQTSIPAGLNNVVLVAGGGFHNLALKRDGTVVAWGNNLNNQSSIPAGLNNVVQVAGGGFHNLALKLDGTVVAWGSNLYGLTSIPAGLNNVVQVVGGYRHNLALKADGTVVAWGSNYVGQTNIPAGLKKVVQIAGGEDHSIALNADGMLVAWGINNYGQTTIPVGLNNVIQIFAGGSNSLALKKDGTIAAWGNNDYGQTSIPAGLNNVVQIATGNYFNLALKSDDTVVTWGYNVDGQTTLPKNLNYVKQITAGVQHSLAIAKIYINTTTNTGGTITPTTFVKNGDKLRITYQPNTGYFVDTIFINGVLNTDSLSGYTFNNIYQYQTLRVVFTPTTAPSKPRNVIGIGGNNKAILSFLPPTNFGSKSIVKYIAKVVGTNIKDSSTNTAITLTGLNRGQAYNITIQAVNNEGLISDTALVSNILLIPITEIISTNKPTYKIGDTIQLRGNGIKTLKLKSFASRDSFVITNFITKTTINSDTNYTFIVPNKVKNDVYFINAFSYTNQLSESNRLVRFFVLPSNIDSLGGIAWGDNGFGQTNIPAGLNNVVQVAGGNYHNLALKGDGTVVAWGWNDNGQTSIPAGLNNVVQIAGGYGHSLALKADGTMVAWGGNDYGQSSIPAGLNNVVKISAGGYHSLALKADGTLVAWGSNGNGQTNIPAGLNNVVQIGAGRFHSLALKADGTMLAWGYNGYGQTSTPLGLNNVIQISAGLNHSLALKADGTVIVWGDNEFGQTNIPAGLNNVVQIVAGRFHSLALKADGTLVAWGNNVDGQTTIPKGLNYVEQITAGVQHNFVISKLYINTTSNIGGTITPTTFVKYGDKLRITYQPNTGYYIDSIFVNGVLNTDSLTGFTFNNIYQYQTIRVLYKLYTFTIISSAETGGSISPQGTSSVNYVTKLQYTITPNIGYAVDTLFVNGNRVDSTTSYTFDNVKSNQTIRASFKKIKTYSIVSTAGKGGNISPQDTIILNYGTKAQYTITPNTGFILDSLFVNGLKVDSITSYTFDSVKSNQTISVKFKVQTFIITSSAGYGGSISPQGISILNYGAKPSYTITPNTGFILDTLFVNGLKVDSITSYTFDSVKSNQTIRASFKIKTYSIVSSAGTGGSISPQGTNTINYGARFTFTFTPNNGYIIDSIIVNGFKINNVSSYTFESVKSNQTIRIVYKNLKTFKFKLNFYLNNYFQNNIYLDSNSNYRISYSIPNGYYIDSFYTNLGENLNKDSVFAYTFTNINANRDIFLILKQKQINVQIIGVNGNQFSININDRTLAKKDSTKLSYFYGNKLNAYLQTDSNFYIDSIWIDNSVLYSYKKQASSNETNPINSYNLNINNLFNNTIVKIKLGQFTPPAPPRLDTVIVANAQAYLYFTPPTNNGGVSILKYEVSSINQNIKLYATQSPVRITGLQNDSNYQFVIKAINKVGTSIASNVSNVIIPKNNVYVVTTNVTNGLISGGASITNNGTYRVTYQANSGFQLDKVYVNDTLRNDSTQGYSFKNFNRNQYIYVVFKPIIYKLLAQSNNGGMFILNRESKQQINISTNAGSNNAIIIQANYGYKIDSIFVNNVLKPFTNKQLTQINILNILGDSTIRVVFKKASYVVKINYGKGGQVYPSNQINVLENDSINIRLFPNYGYELDSIFINNQYINTSVKTNYWFKNVQGDSTIRVVFKNVLYSITSSVKNTNGGIISPAGKQFAQKGENKTYYIIPYYGYKIDTIWINEIAVIINPNATSYFAYTFKNIQGDSSIKVSYKKNRSTIVSAVNRINNIRYGRITPSGKVTLINGQGYKYKIIPNSNGKLDSILIDNEKVLLTLNADSSGYDTATQIYTFKNIQSDKSINVFFSSKPAVNNYKINANEYTIISSSNLENALNVEGENIFSAGDNFTYTFEYDTLYYLDSLIIDGVVTNNYLNINNSISYAFTNINANHSIRAVFKKNIFTIISEQDGNGNINYVGTNYVKLGAQIKYSYQAESNYFVDSVIVNGVLIDSPQSFTFTNVQQDNTIKIIYNQSQYTIQSSVTEGGNINPLGTLLLNKGETYTYQYSANAGYSIDSVIIDGIVNYDSLSSYTFTNVQTNHRIQIVYKKNYYTITSSKNIEGGLISNEGINIVVNGSTQLYFIQANAGYKIDSIYINNIGQSINQQTYIYEINNINKDINIYVIFKNIYYTITASTEVGGGISPIGNIQVKYDSSQAFSITPNTGYVIDSVIVNGINVGKINSYTFNNVKGDSNIRVTFKLKTFSITATAGNGGSISPQATTTVNYGSSQRYIITANAGYIIDSVIVNGFKVDSTTSYTFNNITANQTIQAVFKIAVVCPQTKLSPNIVRVGDALKSDITTFAKQRWYLAGTIKDSTTNNTYTPTDAGVYTLLGIDALGCESNLSKKYYYSKTCITPAGRLGNGANIQANIVGNANLIIIKWCTDLIKENITIKILSIDGVSIYEQKVPANLGVYIINKQQINNKNYVIEVIDNKGEVLQISDVVN